MELLLQCQFLKKTWLKKFIYGREKEKLNLCIEKSWCSFAHESLEDAVKNSEIIFLCTPVDTIIPILKIIAPHLKAGAIVTDVGT